MKLILLLNLVTGWTLEYSSVRVEGFMSALVLPGQVLALVSVHVLSDAAADDDEQREDDGEDDAEDD